MTKLVIKLNVDKFVPLTFHILKLEGIITP